ncbi:TetR family transcriptional regulator [Subtercola boreus]|uniref:TetR family transcriptional regulator n=1 Tax=Subtercola boreus TaxID=120213 RepID=A0A3E0VCR4_9MICO|nr:TetR/AcrR family transcriptional regulator [Subtercola boreus]RFA07531.1 TetR family transcriptional regulator [Subtercola boreus]
MGIEERRARNQEARRRLITETARAIAEREGWGAVTTRRLSAEIEYSQPVIYKHFSSLDDITDAVALEGFAELAEALREARLAAGAPGSVAASDAVHAVAIRYATFATDSPALYEAMFTRASRLPFGEGAHPEPSAAFAELRASIAPRAGDDDLELLTEALWAALHGLITLNTNARLRPEHQSARIDLIVNRIVPYAS